MIFLLLVIALVFDLGNFDIIPLIKEEGSISPCIKRIIEVYNDDATVLSIYGNFTKGNFLPHPMQVPIINIDVNKKVYKLNYQPRKELVIIDLINYDFDEIRRLGFLNSVDLLKRKYVILVPSVERSQIPSILQSLWKFDIIDVIFLVYNHKSRSALAEVIISNPLHPLNRCGSVVTHMSGFRCDMIKNRKQKFFRNYSKCGLTYRYEFKFRDVNNERVYITTFLLSEIVATLNLTLFKKHEKHAITNSDNYLLFSDNMRCCIYKSALCGEAFTTNINVWTVPSPKKLGPIEVFKFIFKWNTWVLILLIFIITCLVWWAISACTQSTSFSSTVMDMYSITLTGAVNRVPVGFSLRCLFLSYVIYSIHIQVGFTCKIVQLLTVPQYSAIKTIEELADSDLLVLIPHSSANIIFEMTHEGNKIFEKIKNKVRVLSDNEWLWAHENLKLLENSSIMTGIGNIHAAVKILQRKIYFIHDETIIRTELETFITKPGSYIIQDINKVVSCFRESGLTDYQKKIYGRMQKNSSQYYEETQDSTGNVVLGMKHVYPIFLFWGAGMVIATIAFVLEHVTYYIKNK